METQGAAAPSQREGQPEAPALALDPKAKGGPRFLFSLRFILAMTFGTLVAVAVGAVLAISVSANFANTFSLLNERAVALLNGMEQAIRKETQRAEGAVAALASLHADGSLGAGDRQAALTAMRTLLLSERTVEGLFLLFPGAEPVALIRSAGGYTFEPGPSVLTGDVAARFEARMMEPHGIAVWGEPVEIGGALYHTVSQPLVREGRLDGVAVAAIGRDTMNRVVSELGRSNSTTAFVLNSDGKVIAHSRITSPFDLDEAVPLEEFPDRDLATFSQSNWSEDFGTAETEGVAVYSTAGAGGHIFITKPLPGYAAEPYTLGAYFRKTDIGAEIFRTFASMTAGLAGLVLAVLAAIYLGKRISQPMNQVADAAERLSRFDIEAIEALPRSPIREIDHQADAINRMRVAMREFSRYVPRPLVERLIRTGRVAEDTAEREVTILFTDIVGFTSLSERMDASQTAQFLNDHFEELCCIIEERGGTVDKFMGDSIMAFWGAPEEDPRHACNAVEAARSIAAAIHVDNSKRREKGLAPIRLRMGLHTGRVVVGNIGGGARQNYTIIGDAVNVAQRLEQMGKEIMKPGDEVVALVSDQLVKAVAGEAHFLPAGTRALRGRERPVAIWMLDQGGRPDGSVVRFPGSQSA